MKGTNQPNRLHLEEALSQICTSSSNAKTNGDFGCLKVPWASYYSIYAVHKAERGNRAAQGSPQVQDQVSSR